MRNRVNKNRHAKQTGLRKACSVLLAILMIISAIGYLPVYAQADEDPDDATFLYLATDGSDENDGSKEHPFATLEAAVAASRKYEGTVVINVREGWYQMTQTIELTQEDEDLVIRAYPGEEASFGGGIEVPLADLEYVTDEAILNRIIDVDARAHIRHVNLSKYGLSDFGEMRVNGSEFGSGQNGYPSRLTYKGEFMTIAEYPNTDIREEFLIISEIPNAWVTNRELGNMRQMNYRVAEYDPTLEPDIATGRQWAEFTRYEYWTEADDIWVDGYIGQDWADSVGPLIDISEEGLFTSYAGGYDPRVGGRIKFIHVLEEIDVPGEYYLDHKTGELYVYAPDEMSEAESFEFVNYEKTFITMNGAKNITIQNLQFTGTGATMFTVSNCDGVMFDACDLSNAGDYVINFTKCYNSGIKNSYIHDLNAWGISFIQCGDRQNLISGNCFVINCEIARFSQYRNCYAPAINMYKDVGTLIAHNKIYDAPHEAIQLWSNDVIMEYNEIYNVGYSTFDAGAIYSGRCYNTCGNVVRYNYFHDIPRQLSVVYWDDLMSGQEVYGNIFNNVGNTLACNGGRSNTFVNNLLIDCGGYWGVMGMNEVGTYWCPPQRSIDAGNDVDWHTDIWKEKYPWLAILEEDQPGIPKDNIVQNNFKFNTPGDFTLTGAVTAWGVYEGTVSVELEGCSFTDFFEGDYTRITDYIAEFDTSQWKDIGMYEYTTEDIWTEKADVTYLPLTADELKSLEKPETVKTEIKKPWLKDNGTTGGNTDGTTGGNTTTTVTGDPEILYLDDPNAPVTLFRNALMNLGSSKLHIESIQKEDGYVHIVPSGYDPFYYPFADVTGARYVAIKYRAENAEGTDVQFYIGSSGTAPSDDTSMLKQDTISDGEWHVAVFDTQPLIDAGIYDGTKVSYFRFDPLECDYILDEDGNLQLREESYLRQDMPEGAYIDVAYIAFFDDAEKIENYDPDLEPVTLFEAKDIATWTPDGDFTSAERIDGYVHIVPSGGDAFYKPVNNFAAARYVAIKYRAENAEGTAIQFYIGSNGTAPSDDTSMSKQGAISDGEWHIAVVDTQQLNEAGIYDGVNASYFRFDPIDSESIFGDSGTYLGKTPLPEGTYIDIEYIGFFRTEEAAQEFDTSRAAE